MNRKMVFLNLVLLTLVAALGYTFRQRLHNARVQQRSVLQRAAAMRAQSVAAPPALPLAKPVVPAQYFDVADKTLFSRDRNPTVIVEPPPPPPPPPPMPALPFYHGQMAIGEPVAILSTAKSAQRSYHAGESIGEFKLVSWDRDRISFDWNGKTVIRSLAELRPKEAAPEAPGQPGTAAAATQAPAPTKSLGSVSGRSAPVAGQDPLLGPEIAGGNRACVQGDDSASGTTHEGYKKTSMIMLVGPVCYWEKTK